jgi:signal transduction histidine kinase
MTFAKSLQLLLVEDSDDDAELLGVRLRKAGLSFVLTRVETEQAFRQALNMPVDLIICDFSLPQFGSTAALNILREQRLDIPVIIISGAIGEEQAVAAMKMGAVDYLLKDRLGRLPQAIVQGIESHQTRKVLETKRQNLADALAHLERLSLQLVMTQEQERKCLARELHDELGQRMTALNILLHRMRSFMTAEISIAIWHDAERELVSMFSQLREIFTSLRPPALDYFGLETSIIRLIEKQLSSTDIHYVLEYAGVPKDLHNALQITVYRLVQESLTNVLRHAEATKVVIEINGGEVGKELEIVVSDNGKGFELERMRGVPRPGASGSGLLGMRERVELLGGMFQVESELHQGTRVVASIPLKKAN